MFKSKKILVFSVSILVVGLLLTCIMIFTGQAQSQQQKLQAAVLRKADAKDKPPAGKQLTEKELDDASTPIVDYTLPQNALPDDNRKNKNRKFDGKNVVRSNPKSNSERKIFSEVEIPDLPFEISDLVVEGTVSNSVAFLSNDKSGIYSEFYIRVTEIVKASKGIFLKKGDGVTTVRFGGRVKYPSGEIIRYGVSGQGSPTKGKKYLFFLRKMAENDYQILTAYELRGNKVVALDGVRLGIKGRGKSKFDKHTGQNLQDFKKEVGEKLRGGNRRND